VFEIGEAFGGYYAISGRVYGSFLEQQSKQDWLRVVPSLVSALEAIRVADVSRTSGFGGWNSEGNGLRKTWAEHLLAVSEDLPERRTYGWKQKLATLPEGEKTFAWGYELLEQLAHISVPRSLVHCDLMNRNVLVNEGKISGVFDWGCALYGDHLYDLAWFEFWAPWHPELDIEYLRRELEQRWFEVGYAPKDLGPRLLACYLHIGLDHLAYNAYFENWDTLMATAKRMKVLAGYR
jgi:hygromycin-B 4-O-kinase